MIEVVNGRHAGLAVKLHFRSTAVYD